MSSKTAYHEAGHVLVGMRWLGETAREVAIGAMRPGALGGARLPVAAGPRRAHDDAMWRRIRVPEAVMFLGGLAAEEVAGYGRSSGVTRLEEIEAAHGRESLNEALRPAFGPVEDAIDDIEGALSAIADAFPERVDVFGRFLRVYSFTLRSLASMRVPLDRLAGELERHLSLSAAHIETVVGSEISVRRGALQ